jgi:hypothetical protein
MTRDERVRINNLTGFLLIRILGACRVIYKPLESSTRPEHSGDWKIEITRLCSAGSALSSHLLVFSSASRIQLSQK